MRVENRKRRLGWWSLLITSAILIACSSDDSATANNEGDASVLGDGSTSDASTDGAAVVQCTPPAGSPPNGSPIIFAAPSPVAPGDIALLFGGSVGTAATVRGARLADGDPGLPPRLTDCLPDAATTLDVLQAEDLSAKAVIPSTWTPGLFALVVQNATGASLPVILNRPRVDWIRGGSGGVILSGASFDVYGRSFGEAPRAWLVDATGKSTELSVPADAGVATSDGYAATFAVPTLPAGAYSLYLHNGFGGGYGFSDPLAVTIAAATPWPTTVYAVAANTGNDDAAFATAIASAKTNNGGIVQIASGNYTLTQGIVIPPNTVLRSASGNRADVTITFNEAAIPFPYGFTGDHDFSVESITVVSSTSARLFQCPNGPDFMRDPSTGGPQYQPDAPCVNAKLHDVSFTLSTQRFLVSGGAQTTTPTATILAVVNGDDCEISDSTLTNSGGGVLSIARPHRLYLMRNMLSAGATRTPATQAMPLTTDEGSVGGAEAAMYAVHDSAIVGNTAGPKAGLGASATMYIEYDAHNLYVADNTIGPNLSDYGEGFSFDAPYYPHFIGIPTAATGRTLTIPAVLNGAGNSVFEAPAGGTWPANNGSTLPTAGAPALVGNSVVVVNGTGLGQYAEVVSNAATAADGTTQLTIDRDWRIPLDKTSVIAITIVKSQVVFARNTFHDCAVGAQLYSGGYDFLIDGTMGETMEGTYCIGNDFMSQRASATDLQRRFSACYFDQWINTKLTNKVDATYPWAEPSAGDGVYTPYKNGFIGVQLGEGKDPLIPAQRGFGAVGNIVRNNQVQDFTLGLVHNGANGPLPNPLPDFGRDNVIEQNSTQSVPIGVFVDSNIPGSLDRNDTCAPGCTTVSQNLNDGG
jgi:hypothetical protein